MNILKVNCFIVKYIYFLFLVNWIQKNEGVIQNDILKEIYTRICFLRYLFVNRYQFKAWWN